MAFKVSALGVSNTYGQRLLQLLEAKFITLESPVNKHVILMPLYTSTTANIANATDSSYHGRPTRK